MSSQLNRNNDNNTQNKGQKGRGVPPIGGGGATAASATTLMSNGKPTYPQQQQQQQQPPKTAVSGPATPLGRGRGITVGGTNTNITTTTTTTNSSSSNSNTQQQQSRNNIHTAPTAPTTPTPTPTATATATTTPSTTTSPSITSATSSTFAPYSTATSLPKPGGRGNGRGVPTFPISLPQFPQSGALNKPSASNTATTTAAQNSNAPISNPQTPVMQPKPTATTTPITTPVSGSTANNGGSLAPKPPPSTQTQQPPLVQPTPQQPYAHNIPARTFSAPPNLQEQERHVTAHTPYFPEKSTTQLKLNAQPFYPSHPSMPIQPPLVTPFPQPMPPQVYPGMQQQQIPPAIPHRSRNRIPIIDPDTGKEVVAESNTNVSTSRLQPAVSPTISPHMNPYYTPYMPGPYPPYTFKIPPAAPPQKFSFPYIFPEMPVVQAKVPLPETNDTKSSPTKSDLSPKSQRKFSQSKSPQRQEFRVKSPGPGSTSSSPQTTPSKPDEGETLPLLQPEPVTPVLHDLEELAVQQEQPRPDITEQSKPDLTEHTKSDVTEQPKSDVTEQPKSNVTEQPKSDVTEISESSTTFTSTTSATNVEPTAQLVEKEVSPSSQPNEKEVDETQTSEPKSTIYDREFLLQFQSLFVDKPENLPRIEGINDESMKFDREARLRISLGSRSSVYKPGGRPDPVRSSTAPPGFGVPSRGPQRGGVSMSPGNGRARGKRIVRQGSEPGFSQSSGAWVPSRMKRDLETTEQTFEKVTGILNKITEKTFDKLSDKILNIGIDSIEILSGVIKLVFAKAITEPKFCALYADLCRKLSERSPVFEVDGKPQNFKRLLLNRCQEEFESFNTNKKTPSSKPVDEMSADEKTKAEEEEYMAKKRVLGNMTFIGELFNLKMLPEKIMHECITKLLGDLKNPSHDDMEALCKLMTTIGSLLDHAKAKAYMDTYFARMKELSRNKDLPSRIRFMLQDVIALRQSNWTSKKDAIPTAKAPADKGARTVTSIQARPPTQPTEKGKSLQPSQKDGARTSSEPGWETVGSQKGKRPQQQERYSASQPEEVKLRPQTFGPMGGLGAKGWNQPKQPDEQKRTAQSKGIEPQPRRDTKQDKEPFQKRGNDPSPDELEKKTDLLLQEYLSGSDIKEAIECIKDLNAPGYYADVVNKAVSLGIEKKESNREQIAKLFAVLYEEGIFTTQQFIKGFMSVIEILEDLVIDIPKSPFYIASFIGYGILDAYIPFSFLDTCFEHLSQSRNKSTQPAYLVAEVLRTIANTTSHSKLRELYADAKMDITRFFELSNRKNDDYLIKFLEEEKLTGLFPSLTYLKSIDGMIKEDKESDKIVAWIESNVPRDEKIDVAFCRDIVKMILHHVATHSVNIDPILKNFSTLLKSLLSNNKLQLSALLEIQLFYHARPGLKGLVEKILHSLYDLGVLRASVYNNWLEDKEDTTGKEQLVQLMSKWIVTLPEDHDEEEDPQEDFSPRIPPGEDYYEEEEDDSYSRDTYEEEEDE